MGGKKIHMIGIGGVGMAGLAVLLKARGHAVSGCDLHASPRLSWLSSLGISVSIGHDPAHVADADEVIVTPAVPKDAPERRAARNVRFRGEVLAELVNAAPDSIAVCGSHGKTTTATWIAKLLRALGEDVSWCIGGETGSFPVAGAGGGVLVVEADESDGTLALYHAKTLVVNKCEYDHPDHFKTEEEYFACYETAKRNAGSVIESEKLSVGFAADKKLLLGEALGEYDLSARSDFSVLLETMPSHNLRNMRAAIEVAFRRGHRLDDIAAALPAIICDLPDRRFQRVWPLSPSPSTFSIPNTQTPKHPNPSPSTSSIPNTQTPKHPNTSPSTSSIPNTQTPKHPNTFLVYTDYAHHPTEMKCAVGMARRICTGTLRVLFQPHRYSRTKALLEKFPAAFEGADEVVLCPVYAAFEQPAEGGDIADLYRVCRDQGSGSRDQGRRVFLARSCDEAWEHARNSMKPGDLTLLLGAGDIIKLVPRIRKDCAIHCPPAPAPSTSIWIGAGTNTWKSDLNLSVEYVKTEGPAGRPGSTLGIPWMAGIPGTIGGWIKMNAGAFGHSISEVVEAVKVDGSWIPCEKCGFSYRHSDISGEIQDVRFRPLPKGDPNEFLARRKKFPAGTKGSVFKNPDGDFAGRLLEAAECKGLRVGGAFVWSEHANVIVSGPDATASDFLALAQLMRNRVYFRFGIRLEPEVRGLVF